MKGSHRRLKRKADKKLAGSWGTIIRVSDLETKCRDQESGAWISNQIQTPFCSDPARVQIHQGSLQRLRAPPFSPFPSVISMLDCQGLLFLGPNQNCDINCFQRRSSQSNRRMEINQFCMPRSGSLPCKPSDREPWLLPTHYPPTMPYHFEV